MIVFANKGFQTRSDKPDTDWTGQALYVVPDGSALAAKIMANYPYFDLVTEAGELMDVTPTEHPAPEPQPPSETERIEALETAMLALLEG